MSVWEVCQDRFASVHLHICVKLTQAPGCQTLERSQAYVLLST